MRCCPRAYHGRKTEHPRPQCVHHTLLYFARTHARPAAQVLTELVGDKSLERFRLEYEKLHRALKKSHESEKRLIKKCRELNAEIVSNAAKVQTALKLSQEDQNTITSLKREIEKAWKMVDASHEKEARAKETIQQLKTEIQNLSRLVEQGAGLSMGQETAVNELLRAKEELTAERDAQMLRIVEMRNEIGTILERMQQMDADKQAAEREIYTLRELITSKKAEAEREARRRERLDKEVKDVRHLTETRTQELRAKTDSLAKLSEKLGTLEGHLRAQKAQTEAALKQVETSRGRHAKTGHEIEEKLVQIAALRAENVRQQEELKRRDLDADQCRQDIQRKMKERDGALKRNKELEDAKVDVQRQRDALKAAVVALEREINAEKAEGDAGKKAIADLERERAAIHAALKRADGATNKQVDLVKLNEHLIAELEAELGAYKAEGLRQKKELHSFEQQRERHAEEVSEVSARYGRLVQDVKLRDMTIVDLQGKIAESEGRLKQQQKLYEAVRSDRNLYSKNLIEAQDEIAEMKRKFKIMNHQIEQLKEEIQGKEAAYVKEHFEHAKIEKEREALKGELDRAKRAIAASEASISSHRKEVAKLNSIINEADANRLKQKRAYDAIIAERDILGTQLIRRNDELALLYEKLRIQQQTLSAGEKLFAERVDDSHLLRLAINNLTREVRASAAEAVRSAQLVPLAQRDCGCGAATCLCGLAPAAAYPLAHLSRSEPRAVLSDSLHTHLLPMPLPFLLWQMHIAKRQGSNLDSMREELYELQRELLQERTKVRALSEELENPANPHRWRRLEGADPSAYEMVHKIQSLQKRLIAKTEEVRTAPARMLPCALDRRRGHAGARCPVRPRAGPACMPQTAARNARSLGTPSPLPPGATRRWSRRICSRRKRTSSTQSSRPSSRASRGRRWPSSCPYTSSRSAIRPSRSRRWRLSSTCTRRR